MPSHPPKSRTWPRIRVVWSAQSAPKVNWWRGLIGLQTRGGNDRGFVWHLAVKGGLLWSGSLAAILFVLATAVGAYVLSRNPYNRIGYGDLVLPTRWSELREKRGLALIDEGLSDIKAKRYGPGIMRVNHGLQLAPANIPARMVMGQVFSQSGMMQRAVKLLRAGIPYAGGQRRYLDITVKFTEYMEDYDQVLAMVAEAMPTVSSDDAGTRRWLRDKQAAALVKLGRYEEVISLWGDSQTEPSMALNVAWARAMAGVGRGKEAMDVVQEKSKAFGIAEEPWILLMELARQANEPAAGIQAADRLVELKPNDYNLQLQRLVYLTELGADDEARNAVRNYFFRFGLDGTARLTLLKALEKVATKAVMQEVWAQMQSLGNISIPERIAYVQDLITAGEVAKADREFEVTRQAIQTSGSPYEGWLEGTRFLLDVLTTGSSSGISQLQTFCASHPIGPSAYRLLVNGLLKNGRAMAAQEIATLARNRYPAILDLPAIELTAEDLAGSSVVSVPVGKETIQVTNPEARQELAALESDMAKGDWGSSVERIAKVEKSPLAKELNDELLYKRVMIHGQLSNQTEVSWYMRRLLELKSFDPARLRVIAETLHAAGRSDSALTLLREVVRKHPEAGWAYALRETIQETLKTASQEAEPSATRS
jgi:tetratricopeptide (TPR) repeat protein